MLTSILISDCVHSTEPADRHLQIVAALLLETGFLSISPSAGFTPRSFRRWMTPSGTQSKSHWAALCDSPTQNARTLCPTSRQRPCPPVASFPRRDWWTDSLKRHWTWTENGATLYWFPRKQCDESPVFSKARNCTVYCSVGGGTVAKSLGICHEVARFVCRRFMELLYTVINAASSLSWQRLFARTSAFNKGTTMNLWEMRPMYGISFVTRMEVQLMSDCGLEPQALWATNMTSDISLLQQRWKKRTIHYTFRIC